MRIGLCGAHRTGKTTLARAFADRKGFKFINAGVSGVFAELGIDPSISLDVKARLMVQNAILDRYEQLISNETSFVIDRTPIDMIGYMLADLRQDDFAEEGASIARYVQRCADLAKSTLDMAVLIKPCIPVKREPGKGLLDRQYIMGLHWVIAGALEHYHLTHAVMPEGVDTVEGRVAQLESDMVAILRRNTRP